MSSAGERKTVPRSCKNKSLSFKIKALQKDELKSKNKVTNVCECSLLQLDRLEEPGEVLVESSVYWEEAEISCWGPAYNTL